MGRCLGTSGIIVGLVLISISIMLVLLFAIDNQVSNDIIEASFCEDDEILVRKAYSVERRDGQGTSYDFYCENNRNGTQRDITDGVMTVTWGGFAVGLVLGILLIVGSSIGLSMRALKQVTSISSFGEPIPRNVNVHFTQDSYTAAEVEERLRKLQEMLNNGTLSQEQYFKIEQELRSRQR